MAQTDIINIQKHADNVTVSPTQSGYSMVRIHVGTDENDNEIVYEAGNESGAVLDISNPFGTQEMADNILAEVAGMQYQPGKADGAMIDPAAELGDGIVANNAYFGMYIRATEFGRLMKTDAEAPTNQEIEHEFGVEGSEQREYIRATQGVKAMLQIQATEIAAKVSIEDRNMETGFGWSLTNNQWRVGKYTGTSLTPVLTIDENGLQVVGTGQFTGSVTATSGKIGNITINQDGSIVSANNGFRVDAAGNLYATSGTFAGAVYASNIKSDAIDGYGGYFNGGGLSGGSVGAGKIVPYDLSTGQFTGGVNDSLSYANFSNDVFHAADTAPYVQANDVRGGVLHVLKGNTYYDITGHTHTFTEGNGKIYIGPADVTGVAHSFSIADTTAYQNGVSAVAVSSVSSLAYSSSANFVVTLANGVTNYASGYLSGRVNIRLSNGNTYSAMVALQGTKAYNAGYNAGKAAGSGPSKYITAIRYTYGSSAGGYMQIWDHDGGPWDIYILAGDTYYAQ